MATFGQRLRELRKENQMTTKDLSKALDVAQSSISRYENDLREPRRDFLENVSSYFGVTVDYILGNSDDKNGEPVTNKENIELPARFKTAEDAISFLLQQPTLVAFGGYDLSKLSNNELIDFANDILQQIKIVSYKYTK